MKIGIYGDSFAAKWAFNKEENHWWYQLGKMLNAEAKCFGISGSSTFFSYKNFLDNHKKFDINIFFPTNPWRYTKYFTLSSGRKEFLFSYDQIDVVADRYKNQLKSSDLANFDNIRGWFLASDDEFNETCQSLMIKDVVSRDPKVIIYPSFHDSLDAETKHNLNLKIDSCAHDWMRKIDQWFNVSVLDNHTENLEVIACHFTPEINNRFASAMYNYIVKGEPVVVPIEPIKHEYNLEYYFRRK